MEVEALLKYVRDNEDFTNYNEKIFDILEGDLLDQLFQTIDEQLKNNSAKIMKSRAIPINVLKKIISKLSKLYFKTPERTTDNAQNQALIDWYVDEIGVNNKMNDCNESFNAYKNTSMEIIENSDKKILEISSVPSHQFLVWNDGVFERLIPDGYIKFMGTMEKERVKGRGMQKYNVNKYWVYAPNSFMAIDSDGDRVLEDELENQGVNPFGIIPFSYMTKSKYLIIPKIDTDTLRMSTIIPVLLSEISFASMFLANPILYGVDVDTEDLQLSPSQFWNFKSDNPESKPSIGVINPNLDTSQQVKFAKEILGVWLETRNIKAGAIGSVDAENAASGIALAIREMDTTQDREMQEKYFKRFEQDFWRRLGIIHNKLAAVGRLKNRQQFSDPENMQVDIQYAEQNPITDRQTDITNQIALYKAGLISRRKALRTLFPDLSAQQLEELISDVEGDSEIITEAPIVSEVAEVQSSDTEQL